MNMWNRSEGIRIFGGFDETRMQLLLAAPEWDEQGRQEAATSTADATEMWMPQERAVMPR